MRVLMKSRPRSCYENQPLRLRWATIRRSAVRLGCAPGRTVPFGTSASYRFALIQGWAKAPATTLTRTTLVPSAVPTRRRRRRAGPEARGHGAHTNDQYWGAVSGLRAFAHPTPRLFDRKML